MFNKISLVPFPNLFFTLTILIIFGFISLCISNYLYILMIYFSFEKHLQRIKSEMVNEMNIGAKGH